MAFRTFNVGPAKGLHRAAWDGLPNLVVICGPNGSGKSTLLHQLWLNRQTFAEPSTEVIFMGPNRPWRKSELNGAAMYTMPQSYRQILGMDQLPSWQLFAPTGLQFIGGQTREPDSADEAQGLVKLTLAKLGLRRLEALGRVFDREGGQIPAGSLPDIFAPLKNLTHYLLPHLEFSHIDSSNENDVLCLFRRLDVNGVDLVDIDDLSSGEKAVVTLFLPFLESQIQRIIDSTSATLSGDSPSLDRPLPTAIIDEPEIHLHPTLQVSLVDYIRDLSRSGEAQFIIATHSTTILDSLTEDELFLVAPLSSVGDSNQLLRISSTEERLEAIRALTGSTHLVTRCRPIVYLEGERPNASRAVSDQRLIELLIPAATSWVLVSASGRAEAIRSARQLRDAASDGLPGVPVFALVDADRAEASDPDFAISWPVAMIENLLLDAEAIWEVLSAFREQTGLRSADDVKESLSRISGEMIEDEVRLRIKTGLKPVRADLRISDRHSIDEALAILNEDIEHQVAELTQQATNMAALIESVRIHVNDLVANGRQLEAFRGKEVLKLFYERYAKLAFPGYRAFVYVLAQQVKATPRLGQLVHQPVLKIRYYIPPELTTHLQLASTLIPDGTETAVAMKTLSVASAARSKWESSVESLDSANKQGGNREIGLGQLREGVVAVARSLRNHGHSDLERVLLANMVQIGLG